MSVSLSKSLLNCKVNTGNAPRVESNRFQDPNVMVCPTWNHMDLVGRVVCANSFNTKRAGCSNPLDRVNVENNVSRPQYSEHITLNAAGIRGGCVHDAHGSNCNSSTVGAQQQRNERVEAYNYSGSWNNNLNGVIQSACHRN